MTVIVSHTIYTKKGGGFMVFEEPKVEFLEIDLAQAISTSQKCNPNVAWFIDEGDPSVETCDGSNAPMNNCATMVYDGFLN